MISVADACIDGNRLDAIMHIASVARFAIEAWYFDQVYHPDGDPSALTADIAIASIWSVIDTFNGSFADQMTIDAAFAICRAHDVARRKYGKSLPENVGRIVCAQALGEFQRSGGFAITITIGLLMLHNREDET